MSSNLSTPQTVLDAPTPQRFLTTYAEPYRRSEPKTRLSKKARRHATRNARKP